jgi:hypothetical protein
LIKVAVHPDKSPAVEEFFELFKTEWARHDPAEACDVLLTDGTVSPDAQTSLYLLFSSAACPGDLAARTDGIPVGGCRRTRMPGGNELPLYTATRLFSDTESALMTDQETGLAVAYSEVRAGGKVVRAGYDLFAETAHLLSAGQPPENAAIPALDRHIAFLRRLILDAGIPVVEIPPCPPGYNFMACLTHDVDFASIRQHGLDSTVCGFLYRALIGSVRRFFKRQLTLRQVMTNWRAVLSLPLVHLGLCKDFWMQFEQYRRIEEPHRSTFFLIPFRDRPGKEVPGRHPERRALRYDVTDIRQEASKMQTDGWEFGLHGIDAWRDALGARQEKERISSAMNRPDMGIRMHWLCNDERSVTILDEAGFEYDSTSGYNGTIGFKAGTSQVFRPLQVNHLLEIPLHIQDVSLFYPDCLGLDEPTAWKRCMILLEHQKTAGGVVTLLWHMRSPAPERLWGGFYQRLLDECSSAGAWFGTARETADWFRERRQMRLLTDTAADGSLLIHIRSTSDSVRANFNIRIYHPEPCPAKSQPLFTDIIWRGQSEIKTDFRKEPVRYEKG